MLGESEGEQGCSRRNSTANRRCSRQEDGPEQQTIGNPRFPECNGKTYQAIEKKLILGVDDMELPIEPEYGRPRSSMPAMIVLNESYLQNVRSSGLRSKYSEHVSGFRIPCIPFPWSWLVRHSLHRRRGGTQCAFVKNDKRHTQSIKKTKHRDFLLPYVHDNGKYRAQTRRTMSVGW